MLKGSKGRGRGRPRNDETQREQKRNFSVAFTKELIKQVEEIAAFEKRTRNNCIEIMVQDGVKRYYEENPSYNPDIIGKSVLQVAEPPSAYHSKKKRNKPKITLVGEVLAGDYPKRDTTKFIESITVKKTYPRGYYALKVIGKGMQPAVKPGNILIVRPEEQIPDKAIMVVEYKGKTYVCRRKGRTVRGKISYDHTEFSDIAIPLKDVQIQGIVIDIL